MGHPLERNIPPLIDNIEPAVRRAMAKQLTVRGYAIIPYVIEENVWQSVEDLFMKSPAVRNLLKSGAVKVVGALYDVGTGRIEWLPVSEVDAILKRVKSSPAKEVNPLAP